MSNRPRFTEIPPRSPERHACNFYHSVALPDGEVIGQWDLRGAEDAYLGNTDFAGKTVLEIGPASGHLTFHMERAGAQVTCLEPTLAHLWDRVPFEGADTLGWMEHFTENIIGVRNAFWFCHRLYGAKARMIEADPYALPAEIGDFDIGLFGAVLLHCRSPVSLLEQAARRVRETIIVTEMHRPELGERPICEFLPHRGVNQNHTWWSFTPAFFTSALGLLGFTDVQVSFHQQSAPVIDTMVPMFTVVARRPKKG